MIIKSTTMKKLKMILFAMLAVFFCQAQEEISLGDYRFTISASKSGLMGLKLGQLALTSASSEEVKLMGQRMVEHHTRTNKELKKLADHRGLFLLGDLDEKQQKSFEKIAAKKGVEFDKAYTRLMKKGHKQVVKDYKKEIIKGEDIELKSWATATLPLLESQMQGTQAVIELLAKDKLEKLITYKN
jgi:putative membrane protein